MNGNQLHTKDRKLSNGLCLSDLTYMIPSLRYQIRIRPCQCNHGDTWMQSLECD